jgi:hypothetical protein
MTKITMRDDSLAHQIRLYIHSSKKTILVYCSCQTSGEDPLLEGKTVDAVDALEAWRKHERRAKADRSGPHP